MKSARHNAGGFILVTTLWVLAGLALLAAYIDRMVASDVERALMAVHRLESDLDRRSTEATVIYLLATGRMSHRGLILEERQRFSDSLPLHGDGELRVQGEVYAGLGGIRFSIQDEGGLASVNAPEFPLLEALLKRAGVAAADLEWIVPRVQDYIDGDDDLVLNGAEDYHYRQGGSDPPLNWIMASPLELRKVLGVEALLPPDRWRRLWPLLTVRPVFGYNFDTMRPEILAALFDLDGRKVQDVLEEREKRSISRPSLIAMLTGRHLDIDDAEVRVLPSRFMRVSLWREGDAVRLVTGVELTPLGESAPWRKDYRYTEAITAHDDSSIPHETPVQAATALLR